MVYVDESGVHDQSDASLGSPLLPWRPVVVVVLLRFIPRPIRNPVYRVIARNRYRWFGKRDTCRIPTAEEKLRFLD